MLIRHTDWELVRGNFEEMEKKMLREAVTGETICPAGFTIDEIKAGSVGVKLKNLVQELQG